MTRFRFVAAFLLIFGGAAFGRAYQIRVPLDDGRVSFADISRRLSRDIHLPSGIANRLQPDLSINVRGVAGWLAVKGINRALGRGFSVSVGGDALVVSVDPDHLPKSLSQAEVAVRTFTEEAAPDATARQNRRFGLLMPNNVDPSRPMVIVIHGLDGDICSCRDLCQLLHQDGKQPAIFAYPAEQPLAESAALLAKHMQALHETFPALKVSFVTESMGGLIARQYIEGPDYPGGIDRLIMIAPPNQGSNWTALGPVQKVCTNFTLWRTDKTWSPTWLITEGLNEAERDLNPGSAFLKNLNALPRRSTVKYTIIAGDQPVHYRVESDLLEKSAGLISGRVGNWWGFHQMRTALQTKAAKLIEKTGVADGPVKIDQAKLPGVDDFVIIKADHTALFYETDGRPPAAWSAIQQRLGK